MKFVRTLCLVVCLVALHGCTRGAKLSDLGSFFSRSEEEATYPAPVSNAPVATQVAMVKPTPTNQPPATDEVSSQPESVARGFVSEESNRSSWSLPNEIPTPAPPQRDTKISRLPDKSDDFDPRNEYVEDRSSSPQLMLDPDKQYETPAQPQEPQKITGGPLPTDSDSRFPSSTKSTENIATGTQGRTQWERPIDSTPDSLDRDTSSLFKSDPILRDTPMYQSTSSAPPVKDPVVAEIENRVTSARDNLVPPPSGRMPSEPAANAKENLFSAQRDVAEFVIQDEPEEKTTSQLKASLEEKIANSPGAQAIKETFQSTESAVKSVPGYVGEKSKNTAASVSETVANSPGAQSIKETFQSTEAAVKSVPGYVSEKSKNTAASVSETVANSPGAQSIKETFQSTESAIKSVPGYVSEKSKNTATSVSETVANSPGTQAIKETFQSTEAAVKSVPGYVSDQSNNVGTSVSEKFASAQDGASRMKAHASEQLKTGASLFGGSADRNPTEVAERGLGLGSQAPEPMNPARTARPSQSLNADPLDELTVSTNIPTRPTTYARADRSVSSSPPVASQTGASADAPWPDFNTRTDQPLPRSANQMAPPTVPPGSAPQQQSPPVVHGTVRGGQPAPVFSLPTMSGYQFDLSQHRGKVVLLDFWRTTCGPCIKAMPTLDKLRNQYSYDQLVILGMNTDQSMATAQNFLRRNQHNWDQIHVASQSFDLKSAYGMQYVPWLVVIDQVGNIQYAGYNVNQMESTLHELIQLPSILR